MAARNLAMSLLAGRERLLPAQEGRKLVRAAASAGSEHSPGRAAAEALVTSSHAQNNPHVRGLWGDHATGQQLVTEIGGRASPMGGTLSRPSAGGSLVPVVPGAVRRSAAPSGGSVARAAEDAARRRW